MSNSVFPVGGKKTLVTATPTLSVHATYASGDFVGTSATAISFTPCVLSKGGSGWVTSAVMIDYSSATGVAAELWLFDATPAGLPADSAAFTYTDATSPVMIIPFSTWYGATLNCVSMGDGLPRAFKCVSGSDTLYGCIVTRGAPAYASGDVTIKLYIDLD